MPSPRHPRPAARAARAALAALALAAPAASAQGLLEDDLGGAVQLAVAPGGAFVAAALTPAGTRIATYDPGARARAGAPRAIGFDTQVVLLGDGKRFVAAVDGKVAIYALDTGKPLARVPPAVLRGVPPVAAVGRPGALLAIGADDAVLGLDDRGAPVQRLALLAVEREAGRVSALAYAPDGKHLAVGTTGHFVFVVDAVTWKVERTLGRADGAIGALAYARAGAVLAVGCDAGAASLVLYDLTTGQPIAGPARRGEARIAALAVSPDGALLAVGGREARIRIYAIATWKQQAILDGHRAEVQALAWSTDGKRLASATDTGELRVWAPLGD